ncbi:hypothetical protein ACR55_01859 [Bordetella hinzii]|uniref:Uncharacterized protein n=1 Tax=Bordetella hinzii TaxID=103855 RepID=A0AAN1S007_9BORD|nr:hypothetical protein [Bordetella hinzii]AKQ59729.1 hypothetical protein ACR55_01859 [Bordetella hinzii]AZW19149.1 hypothetical protein CS347_21500 [Bordetella hinzii]
MQKVTFTYKNGRERMLSARDAELLQRLGKGTYLTRDMAAARPVVVEVSAASNEVVDLDALDGEALHALARERGVKVHHKAGADKVRAALREATE